MPELVEAVTRGVLAAGALPRDFPTISLGEVFLNPTSLMFRNLMSMDVEEMIRAQPMDAVVLIGGCDKTVPAQLMGAASAGRPAIQLVTGPMMTGRHRGERLGACTDCRSFWAKYRAGERRPDEIDAVEGRLAARPAPAPSWARRARWPARRGARHVAAGYGRDPGRPRRAAGRGRGDGKAAVRLSAVRSTPEQDHHAGVDRERAPRAAGDRRIDQRGRFT